MVNIENQELDKLYSISYFYEFRFIRRSRLLSLRVRDKNDEVSKVIQNYAQAENINRSLSNGLNNFATTLSVIGDYRDARVHRLDAKVISPLSQYSLICKHVREDVRNTFAARDRELTRRSQLDKLRGKNPRNRQLIVSFGSWNIFFYFRDYFIHKWMKIRKFFLTRKRSDSPRQNPS